MIFPTLFFSPRRWILALGLLTIAVIAFTIAYRDGDILEVAVPAGFTVNPVVIGDDTFLFFLPDLGEGGTSNINRLNDKALFVVSAGNDIFFGAYDETYNVFVEATDRERVLGLRVPLSDYYYIKWIRRLPMPDNPEQLILEWIREQEEMQRQGIRP